MLFDKEPNLLIKTKETDVINAISALKTPKEDATTISVAAEENATLVTATITPRVDVNSEANCQNISSKAGGHWSKRRHCNGDQ